MEFFYGLSKLKKDEENRLEAEDIQLLAEALIGDDCALQNEQTEVEEIGVALAVDDECMLKASENQWGGWFNFEIPDQEGGAESSDEEGVTHDTPVKDKDDECADAWKNVNLDNLFKLTKLGERPIKKFNSVEIRYEVEVARLPCILTPDKSMLMMPVILRKILEICTEEFNPDDRIVLSLECQALDPSIYLSMKRFSNFNVDALMQKIEL